MNFSISGLAAGFIYGTCGLYLVRRAKREASIPDLIIGIALMAYPYFTENVYLLWGVGAALLFAARLFS